MLGNSSTAGTLLLLPLVTVLFPAGVTVASVLCLSLPEDDLIGSNGCLFSRLYSWRVYYSCQIKAAFCDWGLYSTPSLILTLSETSATELFRLSAGYQHHQFQGM